MIAFNATIFVVYIGLIKPHSDDFEYWKLFFTESIIIIICIIFLGYDTELVSFSVSQRLMLGWLHIGLMTIILI